MDKDKLQREYDQFSRWYDFRETLPELLAVGKLRRELLESVALESGVQKRSCCTSLVSS